MSKRLIPTVILTITALLAPPAVAAAADFPLRGWWPLNEGRGQAVYDWSGKGNHGYLGSTRSADANDPTWIRGGWWGSALSFGGDDFVRIPSSPALEPQQLTVSLWFRGDGSPGSYSYLMAKGSDECVASSYALQTGRTGGLWFYVWNGQQQFGSGHADPANVWDGRWHHAAGTWNGVNAELYIDGQKIGEGASSPGTIDYTGPAGEGTLGGYRGSCELLFTGDIDNVKVWSTPLPIADIWRRFSYLLGAPTIQ